MVIGQLEIHVQKLILQPYLNMQHKPNSRYMKDLNVESKTLKFEETMPCYLCDLGVRNNLHRTQKKRRIKSDL